MECMQTRFFLVSVALIAGVSLFGSGCGNSTSNQTPTCELTCPDVFAEGCVHGPPSVEDCESGCLETQQACPVEFDAVINCGGEEPTFSCGDNGMVYTDGCETEQDTLYACLAGVPSSCITTCPDVFNEGCVNGPPSIEDCQLGCAETAQACPAEFNAVIDCGGTNPTFSCGDNGMVYTDGCETEQNSLYACLAGP